MKDDRICFNKTLTYLVLLIAAVVGAFYVMNYANTQKLTQQSKASEPQSYQPNKADNLDCQKKTGDSSATCSVGTCGLNRKKASGTSIDGSNVDMSTYDCAENGILSFAGGRCCVDSNYTYVAPTTPPIVTAPSVAPTKVVSGCQDKRAYLSDGTLVGLIKAKPAGEVLRISNLSKLIFGGFQVYTGYLRSTLVPNADNCAVSYKTCMFTQADLGSETAKTWTGYVYKPCKTPIPLNQMSAPQQRNIQNLCTSLRGKVSEKLWNVDTYRVFDGFTLNTPQFDARVVGTNNPDTAYCSVEISTCEITSTTGKAGLKPGDTCTEVH